MKPTPSLWLIILAFTLLAYTCFQPAHLLLVWHSGLPQPDRYHQARNLRRNAIRRYRRWLKWQRRFPLQRVKLRRRKPVLRGAGKQLHSLAANIPNLASKPAPTLPASQAVDPLADLRGHRGWIDQVDERQLWALVQRIRWPHGPCCPACQECDPQYVHCIDPDYHAGLGRWRCEVCAQAGDPGEGGTFTPLTGTLFDGMQTDIRTFWLILEAFADGKASVETAKETQVHRHTTDRFFRLLRAALYLTRSKEPIVLRPEDVAGFDEVYITAGLKGNAGGLELERKPRPRGLKQRGRGTWDTDRVPVFGLLCRKGQVRLFALENVQTDTIRPIVHQMVRQGATVYTDSYSIYHFLSREGYRHQTVNHGAGEYALDLDGDGRCEVHCNTMECTWSWLRPMIRTFRGISKSLP